MSTQSATHDPPSAFRYGWASWGDINAFFGLMLDNMAVMVLLTALITSNVPLEMQQPGQYSFTSQFVVTHMIPGTALGVLVGDLIYTWMAFRLARKAGRTDVTAMPLGLDTPSTFGIPLLVLLPALRDFIKRTDSPVTPEVHEEAMLFAWHVGLLVLVFVGMFKIAFTPFGNAIRRWIPRAGLLGSLAAIALTLIAFLPLWEHIASVPLVGILTLTVILVTLVAHRRLPWNFPGALAAVLIGLIAYLILDQIGRHGGITLVPSLEHKENLAFQMPRLLSFLRGDGGGAGWWTSVLWTALEKMPVALPFALATIVGGIDCTESAAAAGDEYDTRTVLLTEGVASVTAGLLGGVIQTTPYIGHPAYKAMGGRAAYTLATAVFIGAAGLFGWFGLLYEWLPKPVMFPILVFIGLEITAQSFRATATRHYPALAFAVLPALATLALIAVKDLYGDQKALARSEVMMQTLTCLANGFIVTSLLWGAALAAILDGRLVRAAVYFLVAGSLALFGIIHSPLPEAPIAFPHHVYKQLADKPAVLCQSPYHWAAAYVLAAILLLGLVLFRREGNTQNSESH